MNLDNYVSGEKIAKLADIQWVPGQELPNRDAVVYTATHNWREVFNAIGQNHRCNYVLITHNSDVNVAKEIYREKPANIVLWFAQNVCCDKGDLIPVPIGIANSEWPHGNLHDLSRAQETYGGIPCYDCSFRCKIETNLSERIRWAQHLWKLSGNMRGSFLIGNTASLPRTTYFTEILQSKYVACPPGNGADTHRLWEVLYAGRIPIVQWYPGIDIMNVPCLMVDNPEDITEEMLEQNYTDLKYRVECEINQSSIAFMPYWEQSIANARHILFRYRLEMAHKTVSQWPAWKQNILGGT